MHAEEMRAHLAAAEQHIRKAQARIEAQEKRIEKLPPDSEARRKAEDTLKYLRDLKTTMEGNRGLLYRQLRTKLWEERAGPSFG
jgi:hypothetical protein